MNNKLEKLFHPERFSSCGCMKKVVSQHLYWYGLHKCNNVPMSNFTSKLLKIYFIVSILLKWYPY